MGSSFEVVFVISSIIALALSVLPGPLGSRRPLWDAPSLRTFDAAAIALVTGLLGSRLLYLALHPGQGASSYLVRVMDPSSGGVLLGGLLAGLLSLAFTAWLTERPILRYADGLALPGAVLAFGSWIGCALEACAYGRRTQPSWFSPPSPDYLGIIEARWPTQSIGALSALVMIAVLILWPSPAAPGQRAALGATGLGVSMIVIAALRGDPVSLIAGLRVDTWAGLALTAFGVSCGALAAERGSRKEHD